ncbi:hypothetical protein ABPG75_012261 [Micractinium tetrahymenae]
MGVAGVAFDGSPWVTAASSAALVVASGGFVAAGAFLMARRMAQGGTGFDAPAPVQTARRVQPLQKSSGEQQGGVVPPPRADSVDEVQ